MVRIETSRLVIVNLAPGDAAALREVILQKEASEYAVYDYEWPTSQEAIEEIARNFSRGDSFLAVRLKDMDRFIGFLALAPSEADPAAFDLGYCLGTGFQGQGYATEACRALVDFAFTKLGPSVITTGTAVANGPSCRLLARLGMAVTGQSTVSFRKRSDGSPIEFSGLSFALTRDDWLRQQNRR